MGRWHNDEEHLPDLWPLIAEVAAISTEQHSYSGIFISGFLGENSK